MVVDDVGVVVAILISTMTTVGNLHRILQVIFSQRERGVAFVGG